MHDMLVKLYDLPALARPSTAAAAGASRSGGPIPGNGGSSSSGSSATSRRAGRSNARWRSHRCRPVRSSPCRKRRSSVSPATTARDAISSARRACCLGCNARGSAPRCWSQPWTRCAHAATPTRSSAASGRQRSTDARGCGGDRRIGPRHLRLRAARAVTLSADAMPENGFAVRFLDLLRTGHRCHCRTQRVDSPQSSIVAAGHPNRVRGARGRADAAKENSFAVVFADISGSTSLYESLATRARTR